MALPAPTVLSSSPPSVFTPSSSPSVSSSSLTHRTCACYEDVQLSIENIMHFARLGSKSFVTALVRHFPVLEHLSFPHLTGTVGWGAEEKLFTSLITVENINTLIEKKQLISLVKKFYLPSEASGGLEPPVCVPALVVLTQDKDNIFSHFYYEVGHILYVHPTLHDVKGAVIQLDKQSFSLEQQAMSFVRTDDSVIHSVFGRRKNSGTTDGAYVAEGSLLWAESVQMNYCPPGYDRLTTISIGGNYYTHLASTQHSTAFSYSYAPVLPDTEKSILLTIKKQVQALSANPAIVRLCPPLESNFVESLQAVTQLSIKIIQLIGSYRSDWS